jgi:hypothetical protein
MVATNCVQKTQAPSADMRFKTIQCLVDGVWKFRQESADPPPEVKLCATYLVYHVDKILGIIPREIADHPDLIMVGEDCRD